MYVLAPLPEPVIRNVDVPAVVNPLLPKRVVIEFITSALPVMSIRFHELCGMPAWDSANDERVLTMSVFPSIVTTCTGTSAADIVPARS
jgi:hypothetical protein